MREGPHPATSCRWHCGLHGCTAPPLFPPAWFAARMSAQAGIYRGTTDPLVMHAWHMATEPPDPKNLVLLAGM
jgi:hypothetical protein